jgi:ABC-type transporter Mla subunit MlaD
VVLGALTVPPRIVVRALDDLHTLAQGVRRLTDRDGELDALLQAVKALPRTEDELSRISPPSATTSKGLQAWLEPLHKELTDLDETAEALERSMSSLQAMLKKLPGI